jgi:protein-tyrosine phosphatase
MRSVIIDVRAAEDPRDVVHRAVQALSEGKVVALPTETVYGLAASALSSPAVDRLVEVKGRAAGHPLALCVKSLDDALDFAPDLSPLGRRLARRCWPGPVTLVVDDTHPQSLITQLPENVRQLVVPAGTIGFRAPGHALLREVLRLMAGPLVLTSANRTGQPDATAARQVISELGEDIDVILDDGPAQYGQPSTVVRVRGNRMKILRHGVVSDSHLHRLASFLVAVVCTGNTCRSPMAEAMFRRRVAERLGCKPEELEDRGIMIISAGIAAMEGGRAAAEARQIMSEMGLDLSSHLSQPLTDRLVQSADLILTMTHNHRDAVLAQWPYAHDRIEVLSLDRCDIADPFGGPVEAYRHCAQQIDAALSSRLDGWDLESLLVVKEE